MRATGSTCSQICSPVLYLYKENVYFYICIWTYVCPYVDICVYEWIIKIGWLHLKAQIMFGETVDRRNSERGKSLWTGICGDFTEEVRFPLSWKNRYDFDKESRSGRTSWWGAACE